MAKYNVTRERNGDGTLFEVTGPTGKIESAHPCAYRAAVQLATNLEIDSDIDQSPLRVTEREPGVGFYFQHANPLP